MNFVYPNFLWASTLVLIPIIIHLFNFRRYKIIYFSRVNFLKEVVEDSKSGLKLKHLLVLISRILAILFLVFAFAQPYIPNEQNQSVENSSLIYIDNSYSMEAIGKDGNLLNEAKNNAIELVKSFDENEKVALLTSDLLAIHQRFYSRDEVVDMIKKIDFSPQSTSLVTAINLQVDLLTTLSEQTNKRLFIFSDFQKSIANLEDLKRKEIPTYYYKPIGQQDGNIYVDSVWFEAPVHKIKTPTDIFFRVQNNSTSPQKDLSVTLKIEGNQAAPKRINVEANSYTIGSFNYEDKIAGSKSGSISIKTNQLFFDDEYFFSYETKEKVEILLVKNSNQDNTNLEQLYGVNPYYNYESILLSGLNQEKSRNKEPVVFNNIDKLASGVHDLIDNTLKNGSTVVLVPGFKADLTSWNSFLTKHQLPTLNQKETIDKELSYFNSEDPLYQGVFETTPANYKYPSVQQNYKMSAMGQGNYITLFGFNATSPYLVYSKTGNGRIILMSSPLDLNHSNFLKHALFATSFLRFAETASFQKPLSMTIGDMENFQINNAIDEKNTIHLLNTEFQVDIIPLMINAGNARVISFAQMQDELKYAGFYELTNKQEFKDVLALNYDRKESLIESYELNEIQENFENAGWIEAKPLSIDASGAIDMNALKPYEYWRILLILALVFFAIEILLLKLWKS